MNAIVARNISKRFRIPHERKTTLFQNVLSLAGRRFDYDDFWALKDISFEVAKGETFGIIGRNGSGKSTLLSILAKVYYPDSGSVAINSRIAPFLELGVGFQPELTARENVYIYSSILGISGKEVTKRYDEIFEFAELRKFESMKLKNFSSGMYLRLAFSTAIHANPDIMLIDEVLSVGDEAFQKKCIDKIADFQERGKSIVVVSHSLDMVTTLCQRAMLLHDGRIASIGDTGKVMDAYHAILETG